VGLTTDKGPCPETRSPESLRFCGRDIAQSDLRGPVLTPLLRFLQSKYARFRKTSEGDAFS